LGDLSTPKKAGGMGFLNIYSFSKVVATSTLWRVLTHNDLWKKVLKEKYLSHMSVQNWIRSATFKYHSTSKVWNSLLKVISLIINWLSWKPGSGHLIDLGMDRVLGIGEASILSDSLLNTLKQKGVYVLA
jgi:hypothetical protein